MFVINIYYYVIEPYNLVPKWKYYLSACVALHCCLFEVKEM